MSDILGPTAPSNFAYLGPDSGLRYSMVTLAMQYKDLQGVLNATPDNPTVRFLDAEGNAILVEALGSTPSLAGEYPLTLKDPSLPGFYEFTFLTRGMKSGVYKVEWAGSYTNTDTPPAVVRKAIQGTIAIGEISRTQDFINRVVINLMDDHPQDYELAMPLHQWSQASIYTYIRESQGRINAIGPRRTAYEIEDFPHAVDNLIVTGGTIFALYARSRFEKANELSYSDGHTLTIARADFYKSLADGMYRDWVLAVESWKKSSPPHPIGLKSQQLPFRIFRTVGMLPNYSSFFSG